MSLLTILGFCLYAALEIGSLRDQQTAAGERNRRDSLQLLRIQNNLSALAVTMRDMVDHAEPYPMAAWKNTFDRLRVDLTQALAEERTLAPTRPAAQQAQVTDTATRFWQALDRALALAATGDEPAAADVIRQSALPRHAELSSLVSQLLIRNTQVDDEAVAASREVYTRVIHQIYVLMVVLLFAVGIIGILNILATRRAFDDQRRLSTKMRALTWRMLRMQEQLQARVARELHDEFGQILTALTMLIGRVKGQVKAARDTERETSSVVRDLEEVEAFTKATLERIRRDARLLHPTMLDDFGLEEALGAHVLEFGKRHEILARFACDGSIGSVSSDVRANLFRIVQEALTNIARHAGAHELWVRLSRHDQHLRLEIEDDGRGLPQWAATTASAPATADALGDSSPGPVHIGLGLIGMRERAEALGGRFELRRSAHGGVCILISLAADARMPDESFGLDTLSPA